MTLDDTSSIVSYILDHPEKEVEEACADALHACGLPRRKARSTAEEFSRALVTNAEEATAYADELLEVVSRILRDRGESDLAARMTEARQVIAEGVHAAKAVSGVDVESLGAGGAVN